MRVPLIPKKPVMVIALACPSAGGKGTVRAMLESLSNQHGISWFAVGSTQLREALNCSEASRDVIREKMGLHPQKDEAGFPFTLYLPELVPEAMNSAPAVCVVDGLRTPEQRDYLGTIFPDAFCEVVTVWIDRPFAACCTALAKRDELSLEAATKFLRQEMSGAAPCIHLKPVREVADFVISNCDDLTSLEERVERFWRTAILPRLRTQLSDELLSTQSNLFPEAYPVPNLSIPPKLIPASAVAMAQVGSANCVGWLEQSPPRGNDS